MIIQKACAGQDLPIYGDGLNVRDWLFVTDHCEAISTVLNKGRPGEVYNVGGDAEKTNITVVKTICAILDELKPKPSGNYADQITFVPDRPGHDRRYAIDASKLKDELGWQPRHRFDDGLRATVQWYLDNEQWVERIADGSYRGQRLGVDQ